MTTEIKQIAEQFSEVSKAVNEMKADHDQRIQGVEQSINDVVAHVKRPGAGIETTEKRRSASPELKEFFAKGTLPPETKELSVTNDGQGVSVRSDWKNQIFELVRESSPMRAVANIQTTESNEIEVLVDRDEPQSEWIGELGSRDKTEASYLTRQSIPVHEHYALPEVTLQMLEDSQFDVEGWLQGKVATRFGRQESAAFINGDGNGKPRGILDYGTVPEDQFEWGADPAAYQIGAQYTGLDGDIADPDVLFDLVDSVKAPYLERAGWMMTRAFRNKIRKLKNANDEYLLQESVSAGVPDSLLGYPVRLAEDMPALGADVVGALFGNFRQAYTVVDRLGITVQRDAVTAPGYVKYFARRRVGGALTNPEAVKALVLGSEPA